MFTAVYCVLRITRSLLTLIWVGHETCEHTACWVPSLQVEMDWTHIDQSQSFKTVFLGDSGVGKTCLAKLYVEQQVVTSSTSTIGFDHLIKDVELENGLTVKVGRGQKSSLFCLCVCFCFCYP